MVDLLVLSAKPEDTARRFLDKTVRPIQHGLQALDSQLEITYELTVRSGHLRLAIESKQPRILHFSGYGLNTTGISLGNNAGMIQRVSTQSLSRLFSKFKGQVECVVLQACYDREQTAAIREHISYVVVIHSEMGDGPTIDFSVGFYSGICTGYSYPEAFESGLSAINQQDIPERVRPQLILKNSLLIDPPPPANKKRIFISYSRRGAFDEQVAQKIWEYLSQDYEVFIDQQMVVGTDWAQLIEQELHQSDFLIAIVSERSVVSEMFVGEIEIANRLNRETGRPFILPVRLSYREQLAYPLNAYLNRFNYSFLDSIDDIPQLIEELRQAIAGSTLPLDSELNGPEESISVPSPETAPAPEPSPSAQPILSMPIEGTMRPESRFYIRRDCDEIALSSIQQQGVTLTIKGPRQMGKSSLLMQIINTALQLNKKVVFLDFQVFDQEILKSADKFYPLFCQMITEELGLENQPEEYWEGYQQDNGGNNVFCTEYVKTHILEKLDGAFVLAMDEVDRMFDTDYRQDFFSMLRSWHNARAVPNSHVWRKLDLALVTNTEPYHFINDPNLSPFNVGEVISPKDFTPAQVSELNQRYNTALTSDQEQTLNTLLNGHPYLVRRALYLIDTEQYGFKALVNQAGTDSGPFGDHLRYHLFHIYRRRGLVQGLRQVIQHQTCSDERNAELLIAAGIVRRNGQQVIPRCQLYANYFEEHLSHD